MIYGASTACFYPMDTEASLKRIAELGIKNTEIFFNTFSELELSFLKELRRIADDGGVAIKSVHPFSSFAENYMLFTAYERRFKDTAESYKRYYEACNILGADILVFHGARDKGSVADDLKFERFGLMADQAREYAVTLAQENVVEFCCLVFFAKKFCQERLDLKKDGVRFSVISVGIGVYYHIDPFINKRKKVSAIFTKI